MFRLIAAEGERYAAGRGPPVRRGLGARRQLAAAGRGAGRVGRVRLPGPGLRGPAGPRPRRRGRLLADRHGGREDLAAAGSAATRRPPGSPGWCGQRRDRARADPRRPGGHPARREPGRAGDLVRARLNTEIDAGGQPLANRDVHQDHRTGPGEGASREAVAQRQLTSPARTAEWSDEFTVPAAYLEQNAELAYAGNVYVAQGRTVDTAHLVVSRGHDPRPALRRHDPGPGEEPRARRYRPARSGRPVPRRTPRRSPGPPSCGPAELRHAASRTPPAAVAAGAARTGRDARSRAPWESVVAAAMERDEPLGTAIEAHARRSASSQSNTRHLYELAEAGWWKDVVPQIDDMVRASGSASTTTSGTSPTRSGPRSSRSCGATRSAGGRSRTCWTRSPRAAGRGPVDRRCAPRAGGKRARPGPGRDDGPGLSAPPGGARMGPRGLPGARPAAGRARRAACRASRRSGRSKHGGCRRRAGRAARGLEAARRRGPVIPGAGRHHRPAPGDRPSAGPAGRHDRRRSPRASARCSWPTRPPCSRRWAGASWRPGYVSTPAPRPPRRPTSGPELDSARGSGSTRTAGQAARGGNEELARSAEALARMMEADRGAAPGRRRRPGGVGRGHRGQAEAASQARAELEARGPAHWDEHQAEAQVDGTSEVQAAEDPEAALWNEIDAQQAAEISELNQATAEAEVEQHGGELTGLDPEAADAMAVIQANREAADAAAGQLAEKQAATGPRSSRPVSTSRSCTPSRKPGWRPSPARKADPPTCGGASLRAHAPLRVLAATSSAWHPANSLQVTDLPSRLIAPGSHRSCHHCARSRSMLGGSA